MWILGLLPLQLACGESVEKNVYVRIFSESGTFFNDQSIGCIAGTKESERAIYTWSSEGVELGITPFLDLSILNLMPGDPLTCTVDIFNSRTAITQPPVSVTIGNRNPSAPTVSISWVENEGNPMEAENLLCTGSGSADSDGQDVSYSYEWESDSGVIVFGELLYSNEISAFDTWTCTVTVTDGIIINQNSAELVLQELSNLNTCEPVQYISDAQYSFLGENLGDLAGRAHSSAGDVDGDGLDDILVTAIENDDGGLDAGKVYLILGYSLRLRDTINLSDAAYFFVAENEYDKAGISVSSAGDVDGDGLDDLLIGAINNDDGGLDAGKVYLILGSSLGEDKAINLSSADYSFIGEEASDAAGVSVYSAGDVDGDGLSDILIGAPYNDDSHSNAGKAYVILGSSLGSSSTIDLSTADYSFLGERVNDNAGFSVSSAGDVDADGFDDLLIGAYKNSDGGLKAGKAYLILGSSLGSTSTIELSTAAYSFIGEHPDDNLGRSMFGFGDVDGDGLSDILIGAPYNDDGGLDAGKSYLLKGASLGENATIALSESDNVFIGEEAEDFMGQSVSLSGDLDGDGLADILIGAHGNDEGGLTSGKVYVVLGSSLGGEAAVSLSDDVDYVFIGESPYDYVGRSLSSAGDINGDGLDDILIGVEGNDLGGSNTGKLVLFTGCSAE